jgi:hypothetical protein
MKKKIMTFTIAALFIMNTAALRAGSHEPLIKLEETGKQGLYLYMDSLNGLAKLSIFDENGYKLFNEKVNKRFDFNQVFDLSKLPEGQYAFEIESGNLIKRYSFEIVKNGVEISPECKSIYKPVIMQKNENLDISILNIEGGDVNVALYAPNGKRLVNDKVSGIQSVGKRYDLSKLTAGTYRIVISRDNRTFTELITL